MDDRPAKAPDELEPEVVALMLRAIATAALDNLSATKAQLDGYSDGQSNKFRSPLDGRKLGQVYRTDPDPEWRIVDRAALVEHLSGFEGNWHTDLRIAGDEAEVMGVLQEHAPHLLEEVRYIPEWIVEAALRESMETDEAAAPGIKKIKPSGTLTVKPDKNEAGPAFAALVQAGWLTWDGKRAIGGKAA